MNRMASFSIKLPFSFSSSSSSYKPSVSCILPPYSNFLHFKSITFQSTSTKYPTPSFSIQQHVDENDDDQKLPLNLQNIINLFQSESNPRNKYQQLLYYAKNLPPLDDKYKTQDNKVQGCVSQVWLRAYLQDQLVYFQADSDSSMTKGLAALLVNSFSGLSVSDILKVSPNFITRLGLQQSLTQSRNNGFINMFRLMQRKALFLGLHSDQNQNQQPHLVGSESSNLDAENQNQMESSSLDHAGTDMTSSSGLGERGQRIKEILERELKPLELEIEDISHQHAGHMAVRGTGDGETHFNVNIVSPEFQGKSLVRRHRMVYQLLQPELDSGLHALSIIAKTPQELDSDS